MKMKIFGTLLLSFLLLIIVKSETTTSVFDNAQKMERQKLSF
ncbi:hypothetical protein [Sphingobacterium kitahiroshimense]|uniref:Uncharacterized protein n=1 Tax=Sphingobacterium kitahiroshimense TaxID=470446 RepID=A0ABV0BQ11_9SPHI